MGKETLISKEREVNTIVLLLRDDPLLFDDWPALSRKLNVPEIMIKRHRNNLLINKENHDDVYTNILHFWIGNNVGTSTLESLCIALSDLGNFNLSEKLMKNFKANIDSNMENLIKSGKEFTSIPEGTREFFQSTCSKVLLVQSEDPDITLARFFDKISSEFLVEGHLDRDFGVAGIFKFNNECNQQLWTLLKRSSKSIAVYQGNVEISPSIMNHKDISHIIDELKWDDLTSSFKQRLAKKVKEDTEDDSLDIDEIPKTSKVLCKWIKGCDGHLLAELMDTYISEVLQGIPNVHNVLFSIAAQYFLSAFAGHAYVDKCVSPEAKEKLLQLVKRKFVLVDVRDGVNTVYKFTNKYVSSFIAAKLIAKICQIYNLSASSLAILKEATGKLEFLSKMHLYFYMHDQKLEIPEDFIIPTEVVVISLVKLPNEVVIRFLNDCNKAINVHTIIVCCEIHRASFLHIVALFRKDSLFELGKVLLHDFSFKDRLADKDFRNIVAAFVQNTHHCPDDLIKEKAQLIECILETDPSLVNGFGSQIEYPLASSPNIHVELIKTLLENGAAMSIHKSVLTNSARYLSTAEVEELINFLGEKGYIGHLNCIEGGKQMHSLTPLHVVIEHHEISESSIKQFLRAGVDVNIGAPVGSTALQWAVINRRSKNFLKMLVDLGANWKAVTHSQEQTILHLAAHWGNLDAINYFHELGADINALNSEKQTPLYLALLKPKDNYNEILQALRKLGAKF